MFCGRSAAASEVVDVRDDICQRNWDAVCPDGSSRCVRSAFLVRVCVKVGVALAVRSVRHRRATAVVCLVLIFVGTLH